MHPFLYAYVHLCIVTSIKCHYVSLQITSSLYFTTFPTFQISNTKFSCWLNLLLSKFITILLTTMTSLRFESFIFYLKFCHSSVFSCNVFCSYSFTSPDGFPISVSSPYLPNVIFFLSQKNKNKTAQAASTTKYIQKWNKTINAKTKIHWYIEICVC